MTTEKATTAGVSGFDWQMTPAGRILVSLALAAVADHAFTTRDLSFRGETADDNYGRLAHVLGVASAVGLTRVTQNLLFEVSALDPTAFLIAATTMMAIGVVAALVPANRATRVDPTTALRAE